MANLVSTTITGTLNTTSTITGPGSGVSAINASNVSTGTLASDRLPTVPTTKGGTGLTSVGTSGQVLTVTAPGALAFQTPAAGGGDYIQRVYTSPATWTKPAGLVAVKVTVIGGGGNGGNGGSGSRGGNGATGGLALEYLDAPAVTGPAAVTVGGPAGTSSFAAYLSATGGTAGQPGSTGTAGTVGSGSGGQINLSGFQNIGAPTLGRDAAFITPLGFGATSVTDATPGQGYGGGGGGSTGTGGTGSPGLVIVEEFY